MHSFKSAFKRAMTDCEVIRNGSSINTYLGLISDSKEHNVINFEPEADVQVGDDIYCPLKKKHYIITNTDITIIDGKPFKLSAYFDNNFVKPNTTNVFNTYNPTNSVIGNQQNVTLNISDCFNNLQRQIEQQPLEDKAQLYELLNLLKSETSNNQINNSVFSKFKDLFNKHANWLIPSVAQIIAAWIQRG